MSDSPAPDQTLESAMDRLEAIVREMEGGELALEVLIARYEEGLALSKLCEDKLAKAEERIHILTRDRSGNPVLEDYEASSEE